MLQNRVQSKVEKGIEDVVARQLEVGARPGCGRGSIWSTSSSSTKFRQFIGRGRMVLNSAGLVPPLHLQRERVVRLMTLGENMAWDT